MNCPHEAPQITTLSLAASACLHAGVTYVDATLANTDIATGGSDALWADGDGGSIADTPLSPPLRSPRQRPQGHN